MEGFARELRTQLDAVSVGARTIKIRPSLHVGALDEMLTDLRARLIKNPVKVPVQPVLSKGALIALREEIIAAGVTVPVKLQPRLVAGAAGTAATSAQAAAIAAGHAQKAQQAGVVSSQFTREVQRDTRAALRDQLASLRQLTAARAKAVAEARAGALAGATTQKEAAALGKAADKELTQAETLLADARARGNKRLQDGAAVQVRVARANVESAGVAERTAAAYRTLSGAQEQLALVQAQSAQAFEQAKLGLLSIKDAAALASAATKALAGSQKALALATEGGNAAQIQQAETLAKEAGSAQEAASAVGHLTVSQEAALKQTNAMIVGTNERRIAQDKLTIATRVDTEAQLAFNAAQRSGQDALIVYTGLMKDFAAARAAEAAATIRSADAQRAIVSAQRPLLNSVERIHAGIARNQAALGSQRAVTNAINLEAQAVDVHARSVKAIDKVGASVVAEAEAAKLATVEFRKLAQAELASAQASTAAGRTRSAATRGAIATTAGFLGLRGAVLASTLPFLAATIAVTAFGKVLGEASAVQASLNSFQAATGATAKQMAEVSKEAQKLGADVKIPATSAADAADAMTELAKAGLSVKDSLAAARGTVQLAAIANIKAGDAAQITASQLNAFQLAGTEAAKVTNLLAAASIMAQGDIGDFALAFKQSATVAHQSGLSINQTTALLTEFARAGLQGSDSGTSLRVMLLRLIPVSKAAAKEMRALDVTPDLKKTIGQQLPDLIDRYRVALGKLSSGGQTRALRTIFGQDAIRAATILFGQNSAALKELIQTQSQGDFTGRLSAARARGLKGAIDSTSSSIQTLAANFGSLFSPAAEAIVREFGKIANAAGGLVEALKPLVAISKVPFKLGLDPGVALEAAVLIGAAVKVSRVMAARAVAVQKAADDEAKGVGQAAAAEEGVVVGSDGSIVKAQQERIAVDAEKTVASVRNAAERSAAAQGESLKVVGVDKAIIDEAVKREVTEAEVTGVVAAETAKRITLYEREALMWAAIQTKMMAGLGVRKAAQVAETAAAAEAGAAGAAGAGGAGAGAAGAAESVGIAALLARGRGGVGALRTGLAGRLGKISIGGIIASLVAEQLGSVVGGTGGGIIQSAGLGAGLGAFAGPEGAAAGAIAFGFGKALTDFFSASHKSAATTRATFLAKWNAMSHDEQVAALHAVANRAEAASAGGVTTTSAKDIRNQAILSFLRSHDVRLKRDPAVAAKIPALQELLVRERQQFATSSAGAPIPALTTQFSLPNTPGQISPGNLDFLHRQVANLPGGKIATVDTISIRVDGREVVIPMVYGGKLHSQQEAIQHYLATHQNLGTFRSIASANAFTQRLHVQQEQFFTAGRGGPTVPGLEQIDLGRLLVPQPRIAPSAAGTIGTQLGPAPRAQFQALAAQQHDNTSAFIAATKTLLRLRLADLARLKVAITKPDADVKDLTKRIKAAFADISGFQQGIDSAISGILTKFTPRLGRLQVAQAQAALTTSSADDAKVAAAFVKDAESRLRSVKEAAKKTKNAAKQISDATVAVLQARQQERQAQQALVQELLSSSPAQQRASIAAARAEGTPGLQDNIDAAVAISAATQAGLKKVVVLAKSGKVTQEQVTEATVAAINAQNNVTQLRKQQVDSAHAGALALAQTNAELAGFLGPAEDQYIALLRKEVATQAKIGKSTQDYATALGNLRAAERQRAEQGRAGALALAQLAAEEKDFIGPNEERYIALLKAAVNRQAKISKRTQDYATAVGNLRSAQQQATSAVQQHRQALFDLKLAQIATSSAQASLTKTTSDDAGPLRQKKSVEEARLHELEAEAKRLERTGKKGTQAWIDAKLAVANMKTEIFNTQGEIDNIKSKSGAGSVAGIFKEAIGAFQQFGSNIAPRGGILSAQQVRGSLGGAIINALLDSSLSEQQKQTAILKAIQNNTDTRPKRAGLLPRHQTVGSNRVIHGIGVGGGAGVTDPVAPPMITITDAADHGYNAN